MDKSGDRFAGSDNDSVLKDICISIKEGGGEGQGLDGESALPTNRWTERMLQESRGVGCRLWVAA